VTLPERNCSAVVSASYEEKATKFMTLWRQSSMFIIIISIIIIITCCSVEAAEY